MPNQLLKLGDDLTLPVDAVTQTFVIFGKRGSGKTNTATVLAEEMLRIAPIVVLDPLDAWWGLKEKYKVYVFGGPHGDLPLDPTAGELMARVFIEHRIPMVLCMKGWTVADRARFVTAFNTYLLNNNGKVPVHVFLEEADALAPQKPYKGEEAMLGSTDRLVRWGRGEGIGATLITQRSAAVNKNVTTQAETLIAHRTLGPQDRDAIDNWLKYHGDQALRLNALGQIANLKDGEAVVWSPEWLNIFKYVQFRRRYSYDSGATPKVGEKRVVPRVLEPVDLEKLSGQLATSIAQAKANDPRELRRRIHELETLIQRNKDAKPQIVEKVVDRIIEVYSMPPAVYDVLMEFKKLSDRAAGLAQTSAVGSGGGERPASDRKVDGMGARTRTSPRQAPLPTCSPVDVSVTRPHDNGNLSGPQQRILDSLAWLVGIGIFPASRAQVAFISRMKPTAGHFNNLLGSLRTKGLIDYPQAGTVELTTQGHETAHHPDGVLTEAALQERILSVLKGPQRKIIEAVIPLGSEGVSRERLAEMVNMNHGAGHFNNLLGSLRTLGLIEYPKQGWVRPSITLYLEA